MKMMRNDVADKADNFLNKQTLTRMVLIGLLCLAAFVAFFRISNYPQAWFDEGWWLQVPKNFAQYGQYASRSSEGFRYTDTIISTSPIFFGGIALSFKLFGVGILQARAVIAIFFLASCVLIYLLGRKWHSASVGLFAVVLFVFVRPQSDDVFTSALLMGRMAMPEIPGIFFLLLGFYLWLAAFESNTSSLKFILAGAVLGISATVKSQFLIVLIPVFTVVAFIDIAWLRQHNFKRHIFSLVAFVAVLALNQIFVAALLGEQGYQKFLADFGAASGSQVRVLFSPKSIVVAARLFLTSSYSLLFIPALLYAVFSSWRTKQKHAGKTIIWVFVLLWLCWFAFASVAWARYAFPAFAVGHLLVAAFVVDVFKQLSTQAYLQNKQPAKPSRILRAMLLRSVFAFAVAALVLQSFLPTAKQLTQAVNNPPQTFATFLEQHVERNAVIETWEWEIIFLAKDHTFHVPPTRLLNKAIDRVQFNRTKIEWDYDFVQYHPKYLVVGMFADWVGVYEETLKSGRAKPVKTIGNYTLFELAP